MCMTRHVVRLAVTCALGATVGCSSPSQRVSETLRDIWPNEPDRLARATLVVANELLASGRPAEAKSLYRELMEQSAFESKRCAAIRGFGLCASIDSMADREAIFRRAGDRTPAERDAVIDALANMADWNLDALQGYANSAHFVSGRLVWSSTPARSAELVRAMARVDIDRAKNYFHEYLTLAYPETRSTLLELIVENPPAPASCELRLFSLAQFGGDPVVCSSRERQLAVDAYLTLAETRSQRGEHERAERMYVRVLRTGVDRGPKVRALRALSRASADAYTVIVIRTTATEPTLEEVQRAIVAIVPRLQGRDLDSNVIEALRATMDEAVSPDIKLTAQKLLDNSE